MNIPLNVPVYCTNGIGGKSTYAIVNPIDREVTHVVVRPTGTYSAEYLVPISEVDATTPDAIVLKLDLKELAKLPYFREYEYVFLPDNPDGVLFLPYAIPVTSGDIPIEHMHVPPGELAVKRGDAVEASDGHIGRVDEFLIDPASRHITHLILREGHLWGQRLVTIPISSIADIKSGVVNLNIDKQSVAGLPTIKVHRG